MTSGFNIQIMNTLMQSWEVRFTWFDCKAGRSYLGCKYEQILHLPIDTVICFWPYLVICSSTDMTSYVWLRSNLLLSNRAFSAGHFVHLFVCRREKHSQSNIKFSVMFDGHQPNPLTQIFLWTYGHPQFCLFTVECVSWFWVGGMDSTV